MFSHEIIIKNKRIEEKVNFSDHTIPLSDRLFGALVCAADAGWWIFIAYLKLVILGLMIVVPCFITIMKVVIKRRR